jgi:hypothetical protein
VDQTFKVFLRVCDRIYSIKRGITVSVKNAALYVVPLDTTRRLWIPLTNQGSTSSTFPRQLSA